MRQRLPELHERNTLLVVVGPAPASKARGAFRHYLGQMPAGFHYLCDPGWSVYSRYGLQSVGGGEAMRLHGAAVVQMVAARPFVLPLPSELARLIGNPTQQGLFAIDELGIVRYAYVGSPVAHLPPIEAVLAGFNS